LSEARRGTQNLVSIIVRIQTHAEKKKAEKQDWEQEEQGKRGRQGDEHFDKLKKDKKNKQLSTLSCTGRFVLSRCAISGMRGSSGFGSVSSEEMDRSTLEMVSAGLQLSLRISRQMPPPELTCKTRKYQWTTTDENIQKFETRTKLLRAEEETNKPTTNNAALG
jgi:hypothetical protein